MKLYLESQVQSIAFDKYGGQAGLELESRQRINQKLQLRIQEKHAKAIKEERLSKRLKKIRECLQEQESGYDDKVPIEQLDQEDI